MEELPFAIAEILKAYQTNDAPALRRWAATMLEWADEIQGHDEWSSAGIEWRR